ncbi:MAG: amino acid ABC transporter permease [Clostridia bacterium]|nr:amino acid ABC transporter permease [Clostridia bacterium]
MDFLKVLKEATPMLIEGVRLTIGISLLSLMIGVIVGLLSCIMGMSKNPVLKGISAVYIWLIRGTPMIVQAFVVYFGVPQLIQKMVPGFTLTAFVAGVITLSLNAGAYLSEIFRSGIEAVDPGQIEASRSLGVSSRITMTRIVLPQAFKITIPSLVNQFIITIKDTSILSVIGMAELVNKAKIYVGSTYQFFATYILVAVYYLVIISVLMIVSKFVEKKFSYDKQ